MERLTLRDDDGRALFTPYGLRIYCSTQATADCICKLEEALQAQEPRVMIYEEIEDHEVLWLEVRDVEHMEEGLAPWVKTGSGRWFSPLFCSAVKPDMILSTPDEYGRICRCWTSRPDQATREAIPWET